MIKLNFTKSLNAPDGVFSLKIKANLELGKIHAIYGKSGAGKTSVLNSIAGLMAPESGTVIVKNKTWLDTDAGIFYTPQQRAPGFLFQEYALFPNMTIKENLGFAQVQPDPVKMDTWVASMELGALQHKKPKQLSGGQQQRAAIARALINGPELILLDEPFSAQDGEMSTKIIALLKRICKESGVTIILLTHDKAAIIDVADLVYELKDGQLIKHGRPSAAFSVSSIGAKVLELMDGLALVQVGTEVVKVKANPGWTIGEAVQLVLKE